MRSFRKTLFLVIPVSFALGVWWGLKIYKNRRASEENFKESITVLTYPRVLSDDMLRRFQNEHGIFVKLREIANPDDLLRTLEGETGDIDVTALYSYQTQAAIQSNWLAPLDPKILKGIFTVSSDFQDIPGDLNHEFFVPVLWGLTGFIYNAKTLTKALDSWDDIFNGNHLLKKIGLMSSPFELYKLATAHASINRDLSNADNATALKKSLNEILNSVTLMPDSMRASLPPAPDLTVMQLNHGEMAFFKDAGPWKFVLPKERATFWILSFGLSAQSHHTLAAQKFLNFLLEKNATLALIENTHQASTSRSVEESHIDARLKPSYLRAVPLTRIHLTSEFNQGPEIASILTQLTTK